MSDDSILRIAVVGHTNTGKTSLLRTLTRDRAFGEVSDRPAVTRHVEGKSLLVDGRPVAELYDTPGLEDSIGLLDHLRELKGTRRGDGIEYIEQFLEGPLASTTYSQEAKSLRLLLDCEIALYVVDARERVLGKHRDELEILAWCARPVVPVLNFEASDDARTELWREHLSRSNMHAVAEFDTVVLDEDDETRLFEKMRSLLDARRDLLERLIADRRAERRRLLRTSSETIADLLLDCAAMLERVQTVDDAARDAGIEAIRERIRTREQAAVETLLELHRFGSEDYHASDLPLDGGRWGLDLFAPEALREFGLQAGGAVATGATIGFGLDVALAGLSLGTGTAAGAAIGALWGLGRRHGRRVIDRVRGSTELRCGPETLRLLAVRQIALVRALLRRGHASVTPVVLERGLMAAGRTAAPKKLPPALTQARLNPDWAAPASAGDARRQQARSELAETARAALERPADQPLEFP